MYVSFPSSFPFPMAQKSEFHNFSIKNLNFNFAVDLTLSLHRFPINSGIILTWALDCFNQDRIKTDLFKMTLMHKRNELGLPTKVNIYTSFLRDKIMILHVPVWFKCRYLTLIQTFLIRLKSDRVLRWL